MSINVPSLLYVKAMKHNDVRTYQYMNELSYCNMALGSCHTKIKYLQKLRHEWEKRQDKAEKPLATFTISCDAKGKSAKLKYS